MIGDSNLRRVNEKSIYAKTDVATGAKIGHIANSLDYVEKEEFETVIIHAGQNNIIQDESTNITEWTKQMQTEVNNIKSKVGKFKNAIVVGVPPAPWCKKNEQTVSMR